MYHLSTEIKADDLHYAVASYLEFDNGRVLKNLVITNKTRHEIAVDICFSNGFVLLNKKTIHANDTLVVDYGLGGWGFHLPTGCSMLSYAIITKEYVPPKEPKKYKIARKLIEQKLR